MPTIADVLTICIALGLAMMAAIESTPGQADRTYQMSQWVQASFSPEAEAVAGAIGEHPEQMFAP